MEDIVWNVKNGILTEVRKCIESKKMDVNEEFGGRCALHYAADYGQAEVIEYLISKGAAVNGTDRYGITALLSAIWEGHTHCVELLLSKGADRTGCSPSGVSYIDCAETEEIKRLLR